MTGRDINSKHERSTASGGETVADPFAVDFFSTDKHESEVLENDELLTDSVDTQEVVTEEELGWSRNWAEHLPRISRAEVGEENYLTLLAPDFSNEIVQITSRAVGSCFLQEKHEVACGLLGKRETDLAQEAKFFAEEDSVFLTFAVEPSNAEISAVISSEMATVLLKTAFGERNLSVERRILSVTELAVLEYFGICCLNELNKNFPGVRLRWRSAMQTLPAFLSEERRGLVYSAEILIEDNFGVGRVIIPFEAFDALRSTITVEQSDVVSALKNIVSGVTMRLNVGTTGIDASDLSILEAGDLILLDSANLRRRGSEYVGRCGLTIAGDLLPSIYGDLITADNDLLNFSVTEISQDLYANRTNTRLNMQETEELDLTAEQDEALDGNGISLAKVAVNLAVEMVTRRVTLEELAQIRAGQVIELGAKATDAVQLSADGKPIAVGHLVDVEGGLGVRIVRVLV